MLAAMSQIKIKDGTAQGVAKIRHYKAMHEESKRLYYDPYAQDMYSGSFIQEQLGIDGTYWLYDLLGPGILEMLTIRTKWLDDQVMEAAAANNMKQLVILGAGYDTHGFRLDLPQNDFQVWEVDQPDVQKKKISNLNYIIQKKKNKNGNSKNPSTKVVSDRIDSFCQICIGRFQCGLSRRQIAECRWFHDEPTYHCHFGRSYAVYSKNVSG